MNFGSRTVEQAKAWRDIWGSGQGIGAIDKVQPAGELIARLAEEYAAAKRAHLRLGERSLQLRRASRPGCRPGGALPDRP